MYRLKQRNGKQSHVGDAVLEACGDECEEAPEDHDELAGVRCGAACTPYCEAYQEVAEDSSCDQGNDACGHLARCRRSHEGRHASGAQSGQMVYQCEKLINEEGDNILDSYIDYCAPLIKGNAMALGDDGLLL